VDSAVAQITASAQTVLKQMPPGITPPLIIQYNASSVPICNTVSAAKNVGAGIVRRDGEPGSRRFVEHARRDDSVPYGGKQRVIAVDLNLSALKAKNIQAQDVVNAINAQNLVLPSGTAKIGSTEYSVAVDANAHVIDD
jgi:multidrug efflux pump subunit AcrB